MTMYINVNPKTKRELSHRIYAGEPLRVVSAGLGTPVQNGVETVCGPHFPKSHTWYAQVEVKDGIVVKVIS